jgi:chaperone required for assembly of F1-ATPase
MNDTRNIAIDVLDNLEYRLGVFDDVLRFLDTDTLVDIALYLMRTYDDNAELEADELKQLKDYANIHGIEG